MLKRYFLLFVLSILIYFLHSIYTKQGLFGDGNGYYVYTNTLFFQKNLNFEPIYNYLSNFNGRDYIFSRIFWNQNYNPYTLGTSLIWLPSMFFISLINYLFSLQNSRFDLLYELGPGITGIVLMIWGLYFLEKYLNFYFSNKISTLTVFSIFFASNVFYYTSFEPALSHQPSFFIISFLLWWTYKFTKSKINLFLLGLLFGLLAIVRMVDIILLLPVVFKANIKLKDFLYLVPGTLIAMLPQFFYQFVNYGSIFINPYFSGANGTWNINLAHFIQYLFSPKRGLFLWTPLFLVSVLGLFKTKQYIMFATILILFLVTSSWSAYLSAGFGQRLSFSAIPYFSYGLAHLINKYSFKKMYFVLLFCILWNFLLIKNVFLHKNFFIQKDTFSYKEFTTYMLRPN